MTPIISDPYESVDPDQKARISADVSIADKNLIKCVHPDRGILQLAVNNLIFALSNDLRNLGLSFYTPEATTTLELLVRRRTSIDTSKEELLRYVRRGATECGERTAHAKAKQPDTKGKAVERRGRE